MLPQSVLGRSFRHREENNYINRATSQTLCSS
jgi:hypothetical protein